MATKIKLAEALLRRKELQGQVRKMGFEKNSIEMTINNMYANAELYKKIADAKRLQGDGYETELKIALKQQEAWEDAVKLLEDAYSDFIK